MRVDFSRLIPAYHAMEREVKRLSALLQESSAGRIRAEDDARLWRSKAEQFEREAQGAREEERRAHHVLEDWMSMRITGMTLWGVAPSLPAQDMTQMELPPRRRSARERAEEAEREFITGLEKRMNDIREQADRDVTSQ